MYTAYVLDEKSKEQLYQRFTPKYLDFIGHHITVEFGVEADTLPPPSDVDIQVVGYVNNPDGLEALVVSIDGSVNRADGGKYHITWSLDRQNFAPKDSNDLLRSTQYTLIMPVAITAQPACL